MKFINAHSGYAQNEFGTCRCTLLPIFFLSREPDEAIRKDAVANLRHHLLVRAAAEDKYLSANICDRKKTFVMRVLAGTQNEHLGLAHDIFKGLHHFHRGHTAFTLHHDHTEEQFVGGVREILGISVQRGEKIASR